MNTIHAILNSNALTVNQIVMEEAPSLDRFKKAIGDSLFRELHTFDNGKPWRKFVIFDALGIRVLYDFEIERILDVQFSFMVRKSDPEPHDIFSGILIINNIRLVANMPERLLPVEGELRFQKSGGWKVESDALFVNMRVLRMRLQAVNLSFRKRPLFACEQKN